jgi:hypothetical protein
MQQKVTEVKQKTGTVNDIVVGQKAEINIWDSTSAQNNARETVARFAGYPYLYKRLG